MRIKRIDEFSDLGTAVFYDFQYFIPDLDYVLDPKLFPGKTESQIQLYNEFITHGRLDTSNKFVDEIRNNIKLFKASKRLIHGSNKHFDGIDFSEYDFNVVLEDQKFNNRDLISYLDKETVSSIGTSLGSLDKINSALFPTLSDSDAQANDVEYFGTLSLSAITLYLFNLDPGMYKIELYEDIIDSNNSDYGGFIDSDCLDALGINHTKPAVTIYLGPNQECKNNPPSSYKSSGSLYNSNDPLINNRGDYYEYEPIEYSNLYDEIFSGKSVWLALSSDKSIKEVNLSYNAWLQSEDANIFKKRFNLRNDEYYEKPRKTYLKSNGDDLIDFRSGKLLGNKPLISNASNPEKSTCPILSRKLKRIGGSNYNPEVEYSQGSKVIHNGETYVALKPGNRGHFPDISSYWVLDSKISDLYTRRITILSEPQTAGVTDPNKQVTIVNEDNIDNMEFSVTANLGYKFGSVQLEWNDSTKEDLDFGSDYLCSDIVDGKDFYNVITILHSGWKKILDDQSRKRLIFKFVPTSTGIVLKYSIDSDATKAMAVVGFDTQVSSDCSDLTGIFLSALSRNGVRYTKSLDINDQISKISIGDEIDFEFALVDYKHQGISRFTDLSITKKVNGETTTTNQDDLPVEYTKWEYWIGHPLDNVPVLHVNTVVDYNDIEIFVMSSTKLVYTVSAFDGFEVDQVNSLVTYGGRQEIRFYGTYRDSLDKILINNYTITNDVVSGETKVYTGYSPYIITLSKSGTMYTLTIDNIVKDLDIKLIEK